LSDEFFLLCIGTGDEVKSGTRLVQAVPRNEINDDLVQLWDFDDQSQHMFVLANTDLCVTGNRSLAFAVVYSCGSTPDQDWTFLDA
jgi:hypothetical protein